jgi:hypothetical protein
MLVEAVQSFQGLVKDKLPVSAIWKEAKIIMISKKDGMCSDPEKFRPISLTSCIGKLVERLIKARLNYFLESNSLISTKQSGFRNNRGAADNLLFIY